MSNKKFKIAGEIIEPGTRKSISIPGVTLYSHTELDIPVHIIRGREDGPVLLITAAIHGDEINGVEIIRRLLKNTFRRKLKGTIIAIPIMNIYGFNSLSRYLPDRRDLNRSFPGSKKGSLAGRLANIFSRKILKHCTHAIDLHTGAKHRPNFPQIRANINNKTVKNYAKAFRAPVVLDSPIRKGSFREAAYNLDIPMLVYEAGEALRFDEMAIKAGVRGILSVMHHLKMLDSSTKGGKSKTSTSINSVVANSSIWVRATKGGIIHPKIKLGSKVHKHQIIATITEPCGQDEIEVESPHEGIIIGINNLPLINEGDALFHLACFNKLKKAENSVEQFQSEDIYFLD